MLKLAWSVVALSVAACGVESGGGDDGGGDDAPPFFDGVSTLSGDAEAAFIDGKRGTARFSNPVNVVYGPDNQLYVADFDNSKIRVVNPEDGFTKTLIDQPEFRRPFGMAFGPDGKLYVTTDCNSTSKTQGAMTGTIWRVENGVAKVIAENIGRPRGIAVLDDGRIAISDWQHHVVQLVNPTTGAVTPIAGTWDGPGMVDGAAAKFSAPYGIAVLDGKLVVADHENQRIRTVSLDGTVATLAGVGTAGFADGAAGSAQLLRPQGITVANGIVYFTDIGNFRVRRVVNGTVETVAGTGVGGFLDSDNPLEAQVYGIEGLAAQPDGSRVFVADGSRGDEIPYNRIRRIEIQ